MGSEQWAYTGTDEWGRRRRSYRSSTTNRISACLATPWRDSGENMETGNRKWFEIQYSLAYACLKLVNYGFFFWLPFYLHSGLHWPETYADALSTWYDVGGIIAAVLAGAFSDHMKSRTPVVLIMLLSATVSLYVYARKIWEKKSDTTIPNSISDSPQSYNWNAFLLMVTGFFIGGPANMISSSITADLGKCDQLRGNAEALSTVTGIIDGTGSIGAAIGQWFIPSVQHCFGWDAVFYGFIVMVSRKQMRDSFTVYRFFAQFFA